MSQVAVVDVEDGVVGVAGVTAVVVATAAPLPGKSVAACGCQHRRVDMSSASSERACPDREIPTASTPAEKLVAARAIARKRDPADRESDMVYRIPYMDRRAFRRKDEVRIR